MPAGIAVVVEEGSLEPTVVLLDVAQRSGKGEEKQSELEVVTNVGATVAERVGYGREL